LNVSADAEILRLESRAGAASTACASTTEGFSQNILKAAETAAAGSSAAATSAPGGAGKSFRAEVEAFEIGIRAEAPARARAGAEALEARLALGVDFAAIERFALALVF